MGVAPVILTADTTVSGNVSHINISGTVEYDSVLQIYRYVNGNYEKWECPEIVSSGVWNKKVGLVGGDNVFVATAHDLVSESDYSNSVTITREPLVFGRGLTNNIITSIGEYLVTALSGTSEFNDVSVLGDRDVDYEKLVASGTGDRLATVPFIVYHIWEVSVPRELELAGKNYLALRRMEMHFFEKTVALRNSLGDYLYQLFVSNEIPLYDYSEGLDNGVYLGKLVFTDVRWATYGQVSPELSILRRAGYLMANIQVMERRW